MWNIKTFKCVRTITETYTCKLIVEGDLLICGMFGRVEVRIFLSFVLFWCNSYPPLISILGIFAKELAMCGYTHWLHPLGSGTLCSQWIAVYIRSWQDKGRKIYSIWFFICWNGLKKKGVGYLYLEGGTRDSYQVRQRVLRSCGEGHDHDQHLHQCNYGKLNIQI